MFSSVFGTVAAAPVAAAASGSNASSSSARQPPKTWSDLSARRPLPIHFVLLPSKRSASTGRAGEGGVSISPSSTSGSSGSPAQKDSTKKPRKGGTSTAASTSADKKHAAAFSNLTPAWACHVPRGALSRATSLRPDTPLSGTGEAQLQHSASASESLASSGSSVTIWRILDPEHREPFISFGALCEACGLSAMEGLVYFADILCRPVHRRPASSGGVGSPEPPISSPRTTPPRSPTPSSSGASLIDLSLAGLEPCAELWIPLPAARKIAAYCGVLEQLALLLSWSTRHAWSLDEGDSGVIHNWRLSPSILPSASYSLISLLSTPITAPIEILTRGTQVRTLISVEERHQIERRWRANPVHLLSSQHGESGGAESGGSSRGGAPAPASRNDAARCGDLRMSLPDHNQETLLRWTVRVLDEYDEAQEMLLAQSHDITGHSSVKARNTSGRPSYAGFHARASEEDEEMLQELLFSAAAEKMAQAGGVSLTNIRLSPNLASILLFLRDIAERVFHSPDASESIASRPPSNMGLSICNSSIRLTDKELAWLAQSSCSSLSSEEVTEEDESKLCVLRAKAKVMLVHYISILYNRTGPPLANNPSQQEAAFSANPSFTGREVPSVATSIGSPMEITSSSTAKRKSRSASDYEQSHEQFQDELYRQNSEALQQMHAMTNARLQKLEQSVHRIESVLQTLVKHIGATDHEGNDAAGAALATGEGPAQRRETRKVHFAGGTSDTQPALRQAQPVVDPFKTAEVPAYQLGNDQSLSHSHSQQPACPSSHDTPQHTLEHTSEPDTASTGIDRSHPEAHEKTSHDHDTSTDRMQMLKPAWMLISEIWGNTTRLLASAALLLGLSAVLGRVISY